jgi:glucose-1-phosphatase
MTEPATIGAVLFDLGGVVCRFDAAARGAAFAALDPTGALTPEAVRGRLWHGEFVARCDEGAYTAAQMLGEIRRRLGLDVPDATVRAAWAAPFTLLPETVAVVDAVRAAARARVGLLTDNPPLLREALDERYPGLLARFDPALFSYEFGAQKPAPVLFAGVIARLGLPAGAILLIDDSPENIAGARAAGMQAEHFTSGAALRVALTTRGLL